MSHITTLYARDGEIYREATGEEIIAAARLQLAARMRRGATLSSPKAVREYLAIRFGTRDHEIFSVIHLDLCGAIIYVHCELVAADRARFRAVWST